MTGRLEPKTDLSVLTDSGRGLNFDLPTLAFTKPSGPTDTVRTGTCQFFLKNVPPFHSHFDLELSIFRSAGMEQTVNVKLEVLHPNAEGASVFTASNGVVTVPARSPVVVSQRVQWTDGEWVTAFNGEERRMPSFQRDASLRVENRCSSPVAGMVTDAQPINLTLSTTNAVDERFDIVSMRFSFYP